MGCVYNCSNADYTNTNSYNSNISSYNILNFDSNTTLSKYETVKNDCMSYLKEYGSNSSSSDQARIIHSYVQNNVYHNYSSNQSSLENLIDSGNGNCLAVTTLYYLLVRDLVKDANISVVTPKGHIATMVDGRFVENTSKRGFDIYFNEPFTVHGNGESAILSALYNNKAANASSISDALNLYTKALECNSNMADVYSNLAHIHLSLGNKSLANECIRNASNLNNSKARLKTVNPNFDAFNIPSFNTTDVFTIPNKSIKPEPDCALNLHIKNVDGIELILIANSENSNIPVDKKSLSDYYSYYNAENKYKYFRKGDEYSL